MTDYGTPFKSHVQEEFRTTLEVGTRNTYIQEGIKKNSKKPQ